MKEINVGLCEGRHPIPGISEYIFANTINPVDFEYMHKVATEWVANNCGVHVTTGVPLNGTEDSVIFSGSVHVNLYLTGLTAAGMAVVQICALNGVELTLMHYDRETGNYKVQPMF